MKHPRTASVDSSAISRWLLASVVLLALTPSTVRAQTTLMGVVRDDNDLVLPGATVLLVMGDQRQTTTVTTTDGEGRYAFVGLPLGPASVVFRIRGFQTVDRDVELTSTPAIVNAVLPLAYSRFLGSVGPDQETGEEYSFTIPRAFRWIWNSSWKSDGPSSLPFDTITVESWACLGACPVYSVQLTRDGHAELNAIAHVGREGRFVGEISTFSFGRLSLLLEKMGFQHLAREYVSNFIDVGGHVVTVKAGTQQWSVKDEGGTGPVELWAVEQIIDKMLDRIDWQPQPR